MPLEPDTYVHGHDFEREPERVVLQPHTLIVLVDQRNDVYESYGTVVPHPSSIRTLSTVYIYIWK